MGGGRQPGASICAISRSIFTIGRHPTQIGLRPIGSSYRYGPVARNPIVLRPPPAHQAPKGFALLSRLSTDRRRKPIPGRFSLRSPARPHPVRDGIERHASWPSPNRCFRLLPGIRDIVLALSQPVVDICAVEQGKEKKKEEKKGGRPTNKPIKQARRLDHTCPCVFSVYDTSTRSRVPPTPLPKHSTSLCHIAHIVRVPSSA